MYLHYVKPVIDFLLALLGVVIFLPFFILISLILAFIHQGKVFFIQKRVGRNAELFSIIKFKTIKENKESNVFLGFLRKSKLDEIPQLFNVLKGEMSIVGPRPDLPGYYDQIEKKYQPILDLKPGLTGWASLKYANEEALLKQQKEPLKFNDEVLFPDKLKINLAYREKVSLLVDVKIILETLFLPFRKHNNE
ncbi:MAG: sugar transferase [Flavobacteriaceae bacterium]|nr:sugar transferase [Flavobacteriaceae bacterium]